MLIGHYAVGFAVRRAVPKAPLAVVIAAPVFLDLLWPIALLLGIESVKIDPRYSAVVPLDLHDYPYTHSLAMAVLWSIAFAVAYGVLAKDRRGAAILGLAAFSHWILDWLTHPPDMPLWPGSATQVGLDLWASVPGTLGVEIALFAGALVLYARTTFPKRPLVLWSFAGTMLAIYLSTVFGPPPPSPTAVAVMALAQWPLLLWVRAIEKR